LFSLGIPKNKTRCNWTCKYFWSITTIDDVCRSSVCSRLLFFPVFSTQASVHIWRASPLTTMIDKIWWMGYLSASLQI